MAKKPPKIIIRPFKHHVSMNSEFAKSTWEFLQDAIDKIQKKNASGLSYEELYRNAYNLVLHKHGQMLYSGVEQAVRSHLQVEGERLASVFDDEEFCKAVGKAWDDHKVAMTMIRDITMYMDRVYVEKSEVPGVYDLGLACFRDTVVLRHVARERAGERVPRDMLRSFTQMWMDVGVGSRDVYERCFETDFLEESAQFYHAESLAFLESSACPQYLEKAQKRLDEEVERVKHYLDDSSERRILAVAERELVAQHMGTLIAMEGSGLVPMLEYDELGHLARMYSLFSRVEGGRDQMRLALEEHLEQVGTTLCVARQGEAEKAPDAYVEELLALRRKYGTFLEKSFAQDKKFLQGINSCFEKFINKNRRSSEYISLYLDIQLRKGFKGVPEEEAERQLDQVMILFRYLRDKDMFEHKYKVHLAKRLLLGRSVSDDAERSMIQKLKTECGYHFTSKLEGMFTDIRLSATRMDEWKEYVGPGGAGSHGIDMYVNVLTTGFWPQNAQALCNLSPELETSCAQFKEFYLAKHTGRKLTWQTNQGFADLKVAFPKGQKEVHVTTYQMVILLLFNQADSLPYEEIFKQSGIPAPSLKRALAGLACGKYRILDKKPRSRAVDEEDVFTFNNGFTCKLFKIKVVPQSSRETDTERTESRERVEEDRTHEIEAAIVRLMKARKQMSHNDLVIGVTEMLKARFLPTPQLIKLRIERLIDREYLERTPENRKLYNYLA